VEGSSSKHIPKKEKRRGGGGTRVTFLIFHTTLGSGEGEKEEMSGCGHPAKKKGEKRNTPRNAGRTLPLSKNPLPQGRGKGKKKLRLRKKASRAKPGRRKKEGKETIFVKGTGRRKKKRGGRKGKRRTVVSPFPGDCLTRKGKGKKKRGKPQRGFLSSSKEKKKNEKRSTPVSESVVHLALDDLEKGEGKKKRGGRTSHGTKERRGQCFLLTERKGGEPALLRRGRTESSMLFFKCVSPKRERGNRSSAII